MSWTLCPGLTRLFINNFPIYIPPQTLLNLSRVSYSLPGNLFRFGRVEADDRRVSDVLPQVRRVIYFWEVLDRVRRDDQGKDSKELTLSLEVKNGIDEHQRVCASRKRGDPETYTTRNGPYGNARY